MSGKLLWRLEPSELATTELAMMLRVPFREKLKSCTLLQWRYGLWVMFGALPYESLCVWFLGCCLSFFVFTYWIPEIPSRLLLYRLIAVSVSGVYWWFCIAFIWGKLWDTIFLTQAEEHRTIEEFLTSEVGLHRRFGKLMSSKWFFI
jgi:hypothetical protein